MNISYERLGDYLLPNYINKTQMSKSLIYLKRGL